MVQQLARVWRMIEIKDKRDGNVDDSESDDILFAGTQKRRRGENFAERRSN